MVDAETLWRAETKGGIARFTSHRHHCPDRHFKAFISFYFWLLLLLFAAVESQFVYRPVALRVVMRTVLVWPFCVTLVSLEAA